VSLSIVPDPAAQSAADALSSQIERLSGLVDRAIDGQDIEGTDALAKLVGALAKLIDARTKAEQAIKPADLARFIEGMTTSINAHVTSPEALVNIRRDWRRIAEELTG
jgi:hypothetical protein